MSIKSKEEQLEYATEMLKQTKSWAASDSDEVNYWKHVIKNLQGTVNDAKEVTWQ